jgi:D-alanyl-lipoteichoic acid acyltransferase DltB (MBOAT superfamily)
VLFNSLIFLYLFLPQTYWVFWTIGNRQFRFLWLTITGYVFYGFWNYKFCALMAFSTLVSYVAGLAMLRWSDPLRRRLCLIVPVVIDLLLLGFFKYANFALGSVTSLAAWLGVSRDDVHWNARGAAAAVGTLCHEYDPSAWPKCVDRRQSW